jgi:hypothetical protein
VALHVPGASSFSQATQAVSDVFLDESARLTWIYSTYVNNVTGAIIDYYEIEVRKLEKQIYPNLPPTQMVGYDGSQPGPTFMMRKGRGSFVMPLHSFSTNALYRSSCPVHQQRSDEGVGTCTRTVQSCAFRWLGLGLCDAGTV